MKRRPLDRERHRRSGRASPLQRVSKSRTSRASLADAHCCCLMPISSYFVILLAGLIAVFSLGTVTQSQGADSTPFLSDQQMRKLFSEQREQLERLRLQIVTNSSVVMVSRDHHRLENDEPLNDASRKQVDDVRKAMKETSVQSIFISKDRAEVTMGISVWGEGIRSKGKGFVYFVGWPGFVVEDTEGSYSRQSPAILYSKVDTNWFIYRDQ